MAAKIAEIMRDEAYAASVEIAREKGAFPLFDEEQYLAAPRFASRLPDALKDEIRKHGLRNSHLLSIAPTGTISLAFADNASNGIEPPYSWTYQRKKRVPDGTLQDLRRGGSRLAAVPASGRRRGQAAAAVRHRAGDLRAGPHAHGGGGLAVRRLGHQQDGQRAGGLSLRGLQGPVPRGLAVGAEGHHHLPAEQGAGQRAVGRQEGAGAERSRHLATPTAASGWRPRPSRPCTACAGRAARSSRPAIRPGPTWSSRRSAASPSSSGHVEDGAPHPFEVWVNGNEQPRGLGAVAKTLSMDMRAQDKAWLRMKLDILARTAGDDAFDCPMPPDGKPQARAEHGGGLRAHRALPRRPARRAARKSEGKSPGARCAVCQEGAEDRHRRHHVLDGGRVQPQLRRRLRADPQGAGAAQRPAPPLLGVDGRGPIRARSTGCASCCRWTCA